MLTETSVGFSMSAWQSEFSSGSSYAQRTLTAKAKLLEPSTFEITAEDGQNQSLLGVKFWVKLFDDHPNKQALAADDAMGSLAVWDNESVIVSLIVGADWFNELSLLFAMGCLEGALLVVRSKDFTAEGDGTTSKWVAREA
jgi:hypothetical protein